jgi:hypothetical protein
MVSGALAGMPHSVDGRAPFFDGKRPMNLLRLIGVIVLLSACAGEPSTAPLEELPLRDALTAPPAAVALLPADARARLAERLESSRLQAAGVVSVASPDRDAESQVRAADGARRERGEDAVALEELAPAADGFIARAIELPEQVAPESPLELEGERAQETAAIEQRALRGRAGTILASVKRAARAQRFVRVIAWPAGIVVHDEVVYVNAAWLVALAEDGAPLAESARPRGGAPLLDERLDPRAEDAGTAGDGGARDAGSGTKARGGCGDSCGRNNRCCENMRSCSGCSNCRGCADCYCGVSGGNCQIAPERHDEMPPNFLRLLALVAPFALLVFLGRRRR